MSVSTNMITSVIHSLTEMLTKDLNLDNTQNLKFHINRKFNQEAHIKLVPSHTKIILKLYNIVRQSW